MTSKQIFEGLLSELSKVNAPSMLLQDFNYFINKAINQYINKRYNIYDINQQTTDDLRVLKSTCILDVTKSIDTEGNPLKALANNDIGMSKLFGATYEVNLPSDYLHILNCVCVYKLNQNWKCYNKGDIVQFAAKRLTADSWSIIINDYYNRPLPWRPYFYIHNINTSKLVPTNPIDENGNGTDMVGDYNYSVTYTYSIKKKDGTGDQIDGVTLNGANFEIKGEDENIIKYPVNDYEIISTTSTPSDSNNSNFPRTIKLGTIGKSTADSVEKETAYRYGNASKVRMEVRYGHDDTVFELQKVFIDYIKTPQYIRLTQDQVNLTQDTSQIMEFPDYVCQEIINELVTLVMENTADPRLQSHPVVTQSIANPAQQQAAPQQQG